MLSKLGKRQNVAGHRATPPEPIGAFEREHSLAHVVVDEPQGFSSSIPAVWEVTSPKLAIVRLHGRNAQTWEKKGLAASSERFDYEYHEQELREFVQPVRSLAEQAQRVHVVFNNNLRDQGIRGVGRSVLCSVLAAVNPPLLVANEQA